LKTVSTHEFEKLERKVKELDSQMFLVWIAIILLVAKLSGTLGISWGWVAIPIAMMFWELVSVYIFASIIIALFGLATSKIHDVPPPTKIIMHQWHR